MSIASLLRTHLANAAPIPLSPSQRAFHDPNPYGEYKPDPWQARIHAARAKRYRFLCGPPGGGKTRTGAEETVHWMQKGKGNILLVAQDFETVRDTMLRELGACLPRSLSKYVTLPRSVGPTMIPIPGGRVIYTRSASNPEGIPSVNGAEFVWGDEVDLWPPRSLDLVIERLNRAYVKPLQRTFLGTLTPELINGGSPVRDKFYNPYTEAQSQGVPSETHFEFFTSFDNPRLTPEDKERIRRENPVGSWGYGRHTAQWVPDPDGLIFPELPPLGQPWLKVAPHEIEEWIAGVDCGERDPFVLTLWGRRKRVWTCFGDYFTVGGSEAVIARGVQAMLGRVGLGVLGAPVTVYHDHDVTQMRHVRNELVKLGINWRYIPADKRGPNSVREQIHAVRQMMIRKELQIDFGAQTTWNRLATHKWTPGAKSDARDKANGHWCDSCRYALYTRLFSVQDRAIRAR